MEAVALAVPPGFLRRPCGIEQNMRARLPRAFIGQGQPNSLALAAGRWACRVCGAVHRRASGALQLRLAACPGRHRLLDVVHHANQPIVGLFGDSDSGSGQTDGRRLRHVCWVRLSGHAQDRRAGEALYPARHTRPA